MIVSLALLAPIVAVLYWIYARTAGRRLKRSDYLALSGIALLVITGTILTHRLIERPDGSLWVYVLAPMVGYGILLAGLALAFWLRPKD